MLSVRIVDDAPRDETPRPVPRVVPHPATIRVLDVRDPDTLKYIGDRVSRFHALWDERAFDDPVGHFLALYTAPHATVFDIAGAGLLSVLRVMPGWRAQVYVASWGRAAHGRHAVPLWRAAMAAACRAHRLLVLDGFIRESNRVARTAAVRAGFVERGTVPDAVMYNGAMQPVTWYEIEARVLGVA